MRKESWLEEKGRTEVGRSGPDNNDEFEGDEVKRERTGPADGERQHLKKNGREMGTSGPLARAGS